MAGKTWEEIKKERLAGASNTGKTWEAVKAERLASLPKTPPVQPKTAQPKSVPTTTKLTSSTPISTKSTTTAPGGITLPAGTEVMDPNKRASTFEFLKNVGYKGITGTNALTVSTLDMISKRMPILEESETYKIPVINKDRTVTFKPQSTRDTSKPSIGDKFINYYKDADAAQGKIVDSMADTPGRKVASTLITGTIQAIPHLVLAVATGGASAEGQAIANADKIKNISTALIDSVKEFGSNPVFWSSFIQISGPTYDKELANGASEDKAFASAVLNGVLGSAIEVSGGIGSKGWMGEWNKGWRGILSTGLEEGAEEIKQYSVENLINKTIGSNTAKVFSLDSSQDAIINPLAQLEQGAYGAAIGGILGGGTIGVAGLVNNAQKSAYNKQVSDVKSNLSPIISSLSGSMVQRGESQEAATRLESALRKTFSGGAVSNKDAKAILDTPEALNLFSHLSGVQISDKQSHSEQRKAIKEYAVAISQGSMPKLLESAEMPQMAEFQRKTEAPESLVSDFSEGGGVILPNANDSISTKTPTMTTAEKLRSKVYDNYYVAGRSGIDMARVSKANGELDAYLEEPERVKAYFAGQNDAKKDLEQRMGAAVVIKSGEIAGDISHLPKKVQRAIKVMVGSNTNVQVVDSIPTNKEGGTANGYYSRGTIYLAKDAENPLFVVAKHEMTHRLKELAPKEYDAFEKFVISTKFNNDAAALAAEIESVKRLHKSHGLEISEAEIMEEIAADFTEELFTDPAAFERLVKKDRNLAERFLDRLRAFIAKIKKVLGVDADISELEQAERLWTAALSAYGPIAVDNQKPTENEDIRFSLKEVTENPEWEPSDSYSYRFYGNTNPMSEWGHAMFADNPYENNFYGKYGFSIERSLLVEFESIREYIKNTYMESIKSNRLKELRDVVYDSDANEYLTPDSFVDTFNPIDIVNSAEAWDNRAALKWFYNNIAKPRGIVGIKTNNGAVVFNSKFIKKDFAATEYFNGDVVINGRFSLKTPVEETPELIAVHNLWDFKLRKALKLGGFPMPSIAIKKADMLHEGFGDISVLFRKETISPTDRRNKVYSGDAWTPTFPQVTYKLDEKAYDAASDRIIKMAGETGKRMPDADNMQDNLRIADGDVGIALQSSIPVMVAYIKSKDPSYTPPYRAVALAGRFDNDLIIRIAEEFGLERLKEMRDMLFDNRWKLVELFNSKVNDFYTKKVGYAMKWDMGINDVDSIINGAIQYLNKGSAEEIDTYAIKIEESEKPEFRQWIDKQFTGIIEGEYIRNNKDFFTSSGNRRSFNVLYDPMTLDNIIKTMKSQDSPAFFVGPGKVRAATVSQFKSIKEIKDEARRFKDLSEEEIEAIKEDMSNRLAEIASKVANTRGSSGNQFTDIDYATEAIEAAARGSRTVDSISKVMAAWDYKVSNTVIHEIQDLFRYLRELPVNMFEAKPERAVGFDEVLAVVVPEDADAGLIKEVQDNGMKVVFYDKDSKESRIEAVNSVPDVRWSLKKNKQRSQDLELLQKQNEALRRELTRSDRTEMKRSAVEDYAKKLIKGYDAEVGRNWLTDKLSVLYKKMSADVVDYAEIKDDATVIARELVESALTLNAELANTYNDLTHYLRTTPVTLPAYAHSELAYHYDGGYNTFRKKHFGKIRLVKDGRYTVDQMYGELLDLWPELFDEGINHEADQLLAISKVLEDVGAVWENPFEYEMADVIEFAANDILEEFFSVSQANKTFADKQADRLTKEKIKGAEQRQRIRDEKNRQIAELRQKGVERRKALLLKERKRRVDGIQALKDKYKAQNENRKTKASMRTRKNQIKAIAKNLRMKLEKPSDKNHIPEDLRIAIYNFMGTLDFTTDKQSDKTREALETFRYTCQLIADGNVPSNQYSDIDPEVLADLLAQIGQLTNSIAKKRIVDMNAKEIEELYNVTKTIKSIVTNYNAFLSEARTEGILETGEAIYSELDSIKDNEDSPYALMRGLDRHFNMATLNPMDFFEQFGKTGYQIYEWLRTAREKQIRNVKAYTDHMSSLISGHEGDMKDWTDKKAVATTFTVADGVLDMTPAQVMSLYLLNKREQAQKHLYSPVGGISLPFTVSWNPVTKKREGKKTNAPVKVTEEEVNRIISSLTLAQIRIAEGISEFLNTTTSDWGNEVSLKMLGYKKFTEEDYFPIVSDKNYINTQYGFEFDSNLKNAGFTKATNEHANNPIVVDDVFEIYYRMADKAAAYNAYVLPLADIQRVLNYKRPDGGGSLKGVITNNLGGKAHEYIKKLMIDLNKGTLPSKDLPITNFLLRNYKTAMMGFNLGVVLQQPTAYVRAWAEIDMKYLAGGVAKKGDYEKVMEYAPIARWKSWGYMTNDIGRSAKEVMLGKKSLNYYAFYAMQKADDMAWSKLWNAVELETRDRHPGLQEGSEEFYEAVAKRFTDVVDRTQVVDTVLNRSHIMRSEDPLSKMYTAFMSEPLKNYNLVRTSILRAKRTGLPEDRNRAVRAVSAFVASTVATSFAASLWYTFRHYDDDDDKSWLDQYLANVKDKLFDNLFSLEPISNILVSKLSGYEFSLMALDGVFSLATTAAERIPKNVVAAAKGEPLPYTWTSLTRRLADDIGKVLGIPIPVVTKDIEAFINNVFMTADNYEAQYAKAKMFKNIKVTANRGAFVDILFASYINGDIEAGRRIYKDMLLEDIPQSYIERQLKSRERKLLSGEMAGFIAEWDSLPESGRTEAKKAEIESKFNANYDRLISTGYSQKQADAAIQRAIKLESTAGKVPTMKEAYKARAKAMEDSTYMEDFEAMLYRLYDAGYNDEDILAAFEAIEEGK